MGKIVVTEFVTIDGVMEDPGGSEGSKVGGWAFEVSMGEDGGAFKGQEAQNASALLLGANTYRSFARDWPQIEDFAMYNAMPKYAVSTTLTGADSTWENTTIIADDVPARIAALRDKHEGEIQVHGSATLAQSLIDNDLVDELRLMVFPLVLGTGKRLFGETGGKKRLHLVESRTVGEGVTILVYAR